MLEERSQPPRAYILYTTYLFHIFFYLFSYSLRDTHYICPIFYIHDSSLWPHFMTPTHNSISRLTFMTPIRTQFLTTTTSCNPKTDGWTVSTPQRHLPSVPTLPLICFGTFSPAWPPPLATAHHHVHHLSWPCVS